MSEIEFQFSLIREGTQIMMKIKAQLIGLLSGAALLLAAPMVWANPEVTACGKTELVPHSDDRFISSYDLMGLTISDLKIARNEIFARHGHVFASDGAMAAYFATCDWYEPLADASENAGIELSYVEQVNVRAVQKTESRRDADMTAVATIPPAQTPWKAIWVTKFENGTERRQNALFANGKLRLDPIVPPDTPMVGIKQDDGGMMMPPMVRLYDFGAGTYGADELNSSEATNEILAFWTNHEWGVREWAVDAPEMLFPSTLEDMSVEIIYENDMPDHRWKRYFLQSNASSSATEETLAGTILVTYDGIILEAELEGRKPIPGEMDQYMDWSARYYLENLERIEDYDKDLLQMPTLLNNAQWHAPG